MGFQLVIATGKEAGREFVFDQASILIGRTADCDVILYEAGVSRQHARIFSEDGAFMVEDMGSSNGTQVNGATVKKQALKDGDAITLGPVVFNFSELANEALGEDQAGTGEMPALDPNAGNHTRVVTAAELKRSRNKGVAMLPKGASAEDLRVKGEARTQALPVIRASNPSGKLVPKPSVPPPPAKFRTTSSGINRRPPAAMERAEEEASGLTAADKARMRRESGALANLRIFWAEAKPPVRVAVMTVGGLLALGLAALVVAELLPKDTGKKRIEPTVLEGDPIKESFGYGDGVTFSRPDEKTFSFDVQSPVAALVILHFMCSDISSQEVSVNVNGTEVGWLPPDTMASNERSNEILITADVIKRNETNTVTFDNVKNPPGQETWKIWNVWREVAVLPEKDEVGLISDARNDIEKARVKWEQRDIGAANRWEAYRMYREAWLMLEAVPPSQRPPEYSIAREKMREIRGELDSTCNKLLLEVRSEVAQKQYDQARLTLDHVTNFFPSKMHPCQTRAEAEREDLEL